MKNCDNCKHWDCGMFTEPCNSCYQTEDGMANWEDPIDSKPTPDIADIDKGYGAICSCKTCVYYGLDISAEPCSSCKINPTILDSRPSNWKGTNSSCAVNNNMLSDILRTALRDLHAAPNCATCVISDEDICAKCTNNHHSEYKWRYEDVALALISDNE